MQAAGPGGGVILDFTPDTAPSLLNAAVAQGLVNQVKWGSSTPIANTFMAGQETAFDGKMYINSEFALLTSKGPDETLYNQINAKYSPKIAIQSFGQIGYHGREVRDAGAAQHQGADHREVVQPRRART